MLQGDNKNGERFIGDMDHQDLILPGDSSFRVTVPIRLLEEQLDWLHEDRAANNR